MWLIPFAMARTVAGVTLPDAVKVAGNTVTLNGMGLREKYFIDIYVGGLYLTHPTRDAAVALVAREPKRIVMHFIYDRVTRAQLVRSFDEDFGSLPGARAQQSQIEMLKTWLPDQVVAGDQVLFDYDPAAGTTFTIAGKRGGTIPGDEFMQLIWGVWLGPKPPTEEIKRGMLGL